MSKDARVLLELETRRLRLRPYRLGDIDALHALWTDPDVRRYLWDGKVISRERTAETVRSSLSDWSHLHYGQWTIRLPETSELIGFCGFRPAAWCGDPELLVGLSPSYWGQGFATEAASATLQFGFETLRVPRVVAATDAPNLASVRVMERLGMPFERCGLLGGLQTLFYAVTAEDFMGSHVR